MICWKTFSACCARPASNWSNALETQILSRPDEELSAQLRVQLAAFAIARTVTNTGHRMFYPFIPEFARGVGVSKEAVTDAVAVRSALGLISPVFGSLAETRGPRVAMTTALVLFAAGMGLVALWPTYPALYLALLLASAAKLIFDPAMQAYVGDHVPYARRGVAIAVTELSWSAAFLLGVPVIGQLIDRSGTWRAPFPIMAACGLLVAGMLWRILPPNTLRSGRRLSLSSGYRIVLAHPAAVAGLMISLLISASNEVVFITYGTWMEDSFGLKIAALGGASAVIGLAELSAEGLVAGVVDRLGKRRAVGLGIGSNVLACLFLPVIGFSLGGALVGLFAFFITFEFAIVSSIPLMTELVPGARATLMAGNVAMFSAGRMLGAFFGPRLFVSGLATNAIAAAVLDVIALAVLVMFIKQE
jgi:predicted MFS family arabinose efflux permease